MIDVIRSAFKRPTTQILAALVLALIVSGIWLGWAVSRGIRSQSWVETPAETVPAFGSNSAGRKHTWRRAKVKYVVDDRTRTQWVYVFGQGEICEPGRRLSVYVNPDVPREVIIRPGFLGIDYGPPLAATLISIAGIAVVLCIKLSPKDDYESEVNESLM